MPNDTGPQAGSVESSAAPVLPAPDYRPTLTHQPTPEEMRTHVTHTIARLILGAFIFTFIISRILVILIMSGSLPPQLFFHFSGTHVHHLNYGIFLLSITGGYLLYARPTGRRINVAAAFYGIGLALTFDEFGMWLHLGGRYWQRASFDAVTVIAAVLVLAAYGSTIRHWHPKHRITIAFLVVAVLLFGGFLYYSVQAYGPHIGSLLEQLEQSGPP